jgi:hypothetical protein
MEEFYAQYMTMKEKIGEYYPIQKGVQYLKTPL